MRPSKTLAAVALLGLAAAVLADPPAGEAGRPLFVRKFLLGHLEPNTNRFIATGGRGTTNAFRDNVILLVFSKSVDFDTLNTRTVKIGIPTGNGLYVEAEGSFYPHTVNRFDAVTGTYIPRRAYRRRVLFDPTSRREPVFQQNPYGFQPFSDYAVTVPGTDRGALKTVGTRGGAPMAITFTTTFRTTGEHLNPWW